MKRHRPPCACGAVTSLDYKFDAYACIPCNKWLETKCADSDCEFCSNRPARPGGGELVQPDEWKNRREPKEDSKLCPCDGHPICETCCLACSCHWVQ